MLTTSVINEGYLPSATKGCYVYGPKEKWYLGTEELPPGDYPEGSIPEIAVDPGCGGISVVNAKTVVQSFTVSVKGDAATKLFGRNNKKLTPRDGCVTFIAIVDPLTVVDFCTIGHPDDDDEPVDLDTLDIDSDVQVHTPHSNPGIEPLAKHSNLHFPLNSATGPYCCTQGEGSLFTHHFAGNYHAVDFRCPVGTEVLSVCDGTVVDVCDTNTCSGIHVSCLYKWNSITVELDCGGFAEYVHLSPSSSLVKVGDTVKRGQQIAASGEIGFCPEPHLHFQLLESQDKKSETLPVRFGDTSFKPAAGSFYDHNGEVKQ
eukprot:TRINITY_DN7740_c3_g1_i1.p1 TRINITY_DN7740_c3_g1~~TRINITY_DN7740_c3_g1_i1.p1  ORF type:complete len:316 (+),score=37.99 TRINITY_DN7740_c3_g1_i1:53-1000(+)